MKLRVLVVDDEADIRESIHILLELEGYDADTVADARHVVASARALSPDIILQDANMPGLDLAAVVRALKTEAVGAPPIVILFTAAANGVELVAASGADGLIRKPIDIDELARHMDTATAARTHAHENT